MLLTATAGRCAVPALLACTAWVWLPGCASVSRWTNDVWGTDYESAEYRAARHERPMLVAFLEGQEKTDKVFRRKVLNDPQVRGELGRFVECTLYRSSEADRRYARQFGIERAPALILVHTDGTYHARVRPDVTAAMQLVRECQPPGDARRADPYLARRVEYRWWSDPDEAFAAAKQKGQPLLVVVHRSMTTDWKRLEPMLMRPEAHRAFRDMVACKVMVLDPLQKAHETAWGQVQLPGLLVVRPDGTVRMCEMPTAAEMVVRFANQSRTDSGG